MIWTSISDGQDLYNALVDQPGVCANCFARTHEHSDDWIPTQVRKSLSDVLSKDKFFTRPPDVVRVYPPEKQTLYPPSRNICKCGVFHYGMKTWDTEDPLTLENLKRNAKNLMRLAEEEDIEFDRMNFACSVLRKKREPEYQNRDEKIFHDAIEEEMLPNIQHRINEGAQPATS